MSKVFFRHIYRTPNSFGEGAMPAAMTIAYSFKEDGKVQVAASRKSLRDQFNRELGRKISEGRLKEQRNGIIYKMDPENMFLDPATVQEFEAENLRTFVNELFSRCENEEITHPE